MFGQLAIDGVFAQATNDNHDFLGLAHNNPLMGNNRFRSSKKRSGLPEQPLLLLQLAKLGKSPRHDWITGLRESF
jgi:hypothetical protein